MRLRTKIIVPITLLIAILILVAGALYYQNSLANTEKKYHETLLRESRSKANEIKTVLTQLRSKISAFASDGTLQECLKGKISPDTNVSREGASANESPLNKGDLGDLKNCDSPTLSEFLKKNKLAISPGFSRAFLTDASGKVLASTDKHDIEKNYASKSFFSLAKENTFLGDVLRNEKNEFSMIISAPIVVDGAFLGIFGADVRLFILEDIFSFSDGEFRSYLLNREGFFLINPGEEKKFVLTKKAEDICGKKPESQKALFFKNYSGENRVGSYVRLSKDSLHWCIVTEAKEEQLFSQAKTGVWQIVAFGVFLIFLLWKLIHSLAGHIFKPLHNLQLAVKVVEKGNLNYTVDTGGHDEIGSLAKSFQKMVDVVRDAGVKIEEEVKRQTAEIQQKNIQLEKALQVMTNLAEDLQKFRLAVETTSDVVFILDTEKKIVYVNDAVAHHTGFSREEAEGKFLFSQDLGMNFMGENFYSQVWQILAEQKKAFRAELNNKRKSQEEYIMDLYMAPILDEQGNVRFFVAIGRDITKMVEADRTKSEFISLASHELRTPLTAVKGYVSLFAGGMLGELNEKQSEMAQKIEHNTSHLIQLINYMLEITKLESGMSEIQKESFDILSLIHEEIQEFEKLYADKKITLGFQNDIQGKDSVFVFSDPGKIKQVFFHLLSNARTFTPEGGQVRIEIASYPKDQNFLVVAVQDTGCGIPRDKFSGVFQKFFQVLDVLHRENEGTGLGLSIVKAIVEKQGGKVWFESEINKGTTFFFTIPRRNR